MKRRAQVYGFLLLLAAAGGGFWLNEKYGWIKTAKAGGKKDDAKKKAEPEAVPVQLAEVRSGPISAQVSSSGNLRALRDVAIATQVEGVVKKVAVEEGDFVQEGQTLVELDDAPVRIRIDLAREKLAQAQSQIEKARIRGDKAKVQIEHTGREYERYRKAFENGLVSESESDRRRLQRDEFVQDQRLADAEIRELDHRVLELRSEIAQAELDLSRAAVKAPFAGFVTRRTVDLGRRLRVADNIFNLGAFSPLYADVFLSEREAHSVRPGQPASVSLGAADSETVTGIVRRLSPVVDQSSGTIKVTVEVHPRGPGFRPGAFVRVEIRTDRREAALLIPKRAVIEEDGESFVYLMEGDKGRRVKIKTGYQSEGVVEVRAGLSAGQQVVVAGQGAIKESSKLKAIKS